MNTVLKAKSNVDFTSLNFLMRLVNSLGGSQKPLGRRQLEQLHILLLENRNGVVDKCAASDAHQSMANEP